MIKKILILFLAWRIFLFVPIISGFYFLSQRPGYGYTLLNYFFQKGLLSNFLLYPFGNFDGAYYLLIAQNGYTINAGFFPLFPLSIALLSPTIGNILPSELSYYFSAITLVTIFFFLSLIFMYKLILLDFKKNIAFLSIVFLLVFPTSFFFASIYSESLFLLLSLMSFYFARKKRWFISCVFAGLLSITRIVGIAILPAILYEYVKYEKSKFKIKILSFFLIPLGLLGYMVFNLLKWGNPFYFIVAQGKFQNNRTVDSVILLPQTIFRYIKILLTLNPNIYEWWIALIEISVFIFAVIFLYVSWKKRIRFSYILFGILTLTFPVSSGTLSGIPRYVLPVFPIFIALSLIENRLIKIFYFVFSIILLSVFFALFSRGYFIS